MFSLSASLLRVGVFSDLLPIFQLYSLFFIAEEFSGFVVCGVFVCLFCCAGWELNSGPHACKASTSSLEPSPSYLGF
jgi:hypothetical protein